MIMIFRESLKVCKEFFPVLRELVRDTFWYEKPLLIFVIPIFLFLFPLILVFYFIIDLIKYYYKEKKEME